MTPETLLINLSDEDLDDVNDALVENGYDIAIGEDRQTIDNVSGTSTATIFLPDGCALAHVWKYAKTREFPGSSKNPITITGQ